MRGILVIASGLLFVCWTDGQELGQEGAITGREPKLGFADGTLTQIAQDLFSRSTTNSQVLSLNLTNLVILLVVKALIFGAGHLGFGGGDHIGRSVDENNIAGGDSLLTESELLLILSYLNGDVTQNYGCLHYSACQDPKKTKEYLMAAKFITKGAELLSFGSNEKYEKLFSGVQEAVDFGTKGYDCNVRYTCEVKT